MYQFYILISIKRKNHWSLFFSSLILSITLLCVDSCISLCIPLLPLIVIHLMRINRTMTSECRSIVVRLFPFHQRAKNNTLTMNELATRLSTLASLKQTRSRERDVDKPTTRQDDEVKCETRNWQCCSSLLATWSQSIPTSKRRADNELFGSCT